MNPTVKVDGMFLLVATGLGLAAYAWHRSEAIGEAVAQGADEAVGAVNPADRRNLANRGFNAWYRYTTGSTGTLGTDIADWFNGSNSPELNPDGGTGGDGDWLGRPADEFDTGREYP